MRHIRGEAYVRSFVPFGTQDDNFECPRISYAPAGIFTIFFWMA